MKHNKLWNKFKNYLQISFKSELTKLSKNFHGQVATFKRQSAAASVPRPVGFYLLSRNSSIRTCTPFGHGPFCGAYTYTPGFSLSSFTRKKFWSTLTVLVLPEISVTARDGDVHVMSQTSAGFQNQRIESRRIPYQS